MATAEKLSEPIVAALTTIIQNNLAAALAKVSASYNDGIPLPVVAPANYYFGERLSVPEYPAIIIDFETADADPEQFSNVWAVYAHTISLDVVLMSDDETVIAHQLARYARALWEICYGNQIDQVTPGGITQAVSVRPRTGSRSPLVPSGDAFLKGWRWVLEVHRYDDLS